MNSVSMPSVGLLPFLLSGKTKLYRYPYSFNALSRASPIPTTATVIKSNDRFEVFQCPQSGFSHSYVGVKSELEAYVCFNALSRASPIPTASVMRSKKTKKCFNALSRASPIPTEEYMLIYNIKWDVSMPSVGLLPFLLGG